MYMDHMPDIIPTVMDKLMPVILGLTSPVDLMVNPQPQPLPASAAPAPHDITSEGAASPTNSKAGKSKSKGKTKTKGKAPAEAGRPAPAATTQAAVTTLTGHAQLQACQAQRAIDHRGLIAGVCPGRRGCNTLAQLPDGLAQTA
jgi:hypothetical protein